MGEVSRYTPDYSRRMISFPTRNLSDVAKQHNCCYFGKIAHDVIGCSSFSIRQDVIRNYEWHSELCCTSRKRPTIFAIKIQCLVVYKKLAKKRQILAVDLMRRTCASSATREFRDVLYLMPRPPPRLYHDLYDKLSSPADV